MADFPVQDRALGLSRAQIGNRRLTAYDPGLALAIVERVAEGETLDEICADKERYPARGTFIKWVAREPELARAYSAAREISALSFEEEAIGIARKGLSMAYTSQELRAAELAISQLRWSAARRDPRNYGERGQAQITVPIHITTSLNLGEGSGGGTSEYPDIYTLDLKPVATPEPTDKPIRPNPSGVHKKPTIKRVLTPRIPMDAEVPVTKSPDRRLTVNKQGKANGKSV